MSMSGAIAFTFALGITAYIIVKIHQWKVASRIARQLCAITGVQKVKTIIQAVGYEFEIYINKDDLDATKKAIKEFMATKALPVPYTILHN